MTGRRPLLRLVLMTIAAGILLVSLTPLEDLSYDLSFQVRPGAAITNAVLVCANNETLNELGDEHGDLSRTNHARLLNRLAEDGAGLVFYDFVFSESNRVPEIDETLARAITNQGSVILVAGVESSTEGGVHIERLVHPTRLFVQAAKGWGHAELFGRVVRKISHDDDYQNYAVWVAAAQIQPQKFTNANANLDRWLNYYGPPDSAVFPRCSFQDALANNVPANFFAKKIVFVGQSFSLDKAATFKDTFDTPYSLFGGDSMPGVEIHAAGALGMAMARGRRLGNDQHGRPVFTLAKTKGLFGFNSRFRGVALVRGLSLCSVAYPLVVVVGRPGVRPDSHGTFFGAAKSEA
jgi:CHASE2 domain-containing sensor protein